MPRELFPFPVVESIKTPTEYPGFAEYPGFEENIKREFQETRNLIWQSSSELLRVMESQYQSQMNSLSTIQEQNMALKKQLSLLQNSILEISIISCSLVALGFFLFGFLMTSTKTIYLFLIFGALALIFPITISLRKSYNCTKRV